MIRIDEAAIDAYVAEHRESTLTYARRVLDGDEVCNANRRVIEHNTEALADLLDQTIAQFLASAWEQDAMDADARDEAAYEWALEHRS